MAMTEHPIQGLMLTAMNSIKDMIDVNTIIGEPIQTINNIVIIPISKVSLGFAAGGSEFKGETIDEYTRKDKNEEIQYRLPFGGGAGAGVSVVPVSFLVVQGDNVRLLSVEHENCIDKLIEYIPDLMNKAKCMLDNFIQNKDEQTEKIIKQIKDNSKKSEQRKDFKQKDFESKASSDVKPEVKSDQQAEVESDGEVFGDDDY